MCDATSRSLTENFLTAFDAALPSLEVLYLTNNSLSAIPASVFDMPKLQALYAGRRRPWRR